MAAPVKAPDSLKAINIFLKTAAEHDSRDPVVAYYCRLYAVQRGMEIDRKSPESKTFLFKVMDMLDSAKAALKDNECISSETVGQAHVENHALKLFANADTRDRNSDFSPATVKLFYTAGILMDVMGVFGEVGEDIQNIRKYAKWKAIYITNCKKTGETPIPGPVDGQGAPEVPSAGWNVGGAGCTPQVPPPTVTTTPPQPSYSNVPSNQPHPSDHHTPAAPASTPVGGPAAAAAAPPANTWTPPKSAGGVELGPDEFSKGMKYCKYASSALQYQDPTTAIDYLQRALTLLTTGKEN